MNKNGLDDNEINTAKSADEPSGGRIKVSRKALFYGMLLLLVAAFWGVGNPVLKIAVGALGPLYCLAMRFSMAFIFFLMLFYNRVIPQLKREHLKPIIIMSIPMTASFVSSAYALKFTTAVNAGFFMSTAVIFTPVLGFFFLKSKMQPGVIRDVAIVAVGIFILSTASGSIKVNPGDLIAILCAISAAAMFVTGRKFVHNIDPILLTVMQVGCTAAGCFIFALIFEDFPDIAAISLPIWGTLIFMSLFCTCLAFAVQNVSLKHVSENYVALIFCMEPVFTAFAAFIMLGERLNLKGVVGAAIIMFAVVIATLNTKSDEEQDLENVVMRDENQAEDKSAGR